MPQRPTPETRTGRSKSSPSREHRRRPSPDSGGRLEGKSNRMPVGPGRPGRTNHRPLGYPSLAPLLAPLLGGRGGRAARTAVPAAPASAVAAGRPTAARASNNTQHGHSTATVHTHVRSPVPLQPGHSPVTARSQHGHSTAIALPQHHTNLQQLAHRRLVRDPVGKRYMAQRGMPASCPASGGPACGVGA